MGYKFLKFQNVCINNLVIKTRTYQVLGPELIEINNNKEKLNRLQVLAIILQ